MAKGGNGEHDPIIEKMLEARENYARQQNKDYSHVFRKKSYVDILRLSALAVGIGFVYAAETAFVSPTLLQIGVDHTTMTMVWGLSPMLGLLLGPLVGSLSDRCRLSVGRRRPMMLILFVAMLVGFIFLPYGINIGQFFGDDSSHINPLLEKNITKDMQEVTTTLPIEYQPNLKFAVIFTVLGTMILDFSSEACLTPARAYMLDVCIPQDHGKALSTFSVMAGLGSTVGYAIGGIDWETTPIGVLLGGNIQAVFFIDTIFLVICFFVTFFSFREIPLPLIEKDERLRPLTAISIKNESLKSNSNNNSNQNYLFSETLSLITNDKDALKIPACYASSYSIQKINPESETVSLGKCLKSIITMPKSMWILSLTNLLCWMGHIGYCLYFTDFVGEAVFHGDPTAPTGSEEYELYEAGVRFGGWGMAVYALSWSIYSFIVEDLMVWFKPKHVYISGIMAYGIGMYILAAWPSKLGVLVISITAGIIYATLYTVPYIIVANYHAKGCFAVCNGENISLEEPRGLATDMAILSSMLFIAQLVIALGIGYVIAWMGSTSAIFYVSSGLSICAAVSAMFVLYLK